MSEVLRIEHALRSYDSAQVAAQRWEIQGLKPVDIARAIVELSARQKQLVTILAEPQPDTRAATLAREWAGLPPEPSPESGPLPAWECVTPGHEMRPGETWERRGVVSATRLSTGEWRVSAGRGSFTITTTGERRHDAAPLQYIDERLGL